MKNLSNKFNNSDLKETCFNMGVAWMIGNVANTISNSVFHFDLDQYHSIKHLVAGVGIGTIAYRKSGGGVKGVLTGVAVASLLGPAWEYFENAYVFHNEKLNTDTILDIVINYVGITAGSVGEMIKYNFTSQEKYPTGKEKWLL